MKRSSRNLFVLSLESNTRYGALTRTIRPGSQIVELVPSLTINSPGSKDAEQVWLGKGQQKTKVGSRAERQLQEQMRETLAQTPCALKCRLACVAATTPGPACCVLGSVGGPRGTQRGVHSESRKCRRLNICQSISVNQLTNSFVRGPFSPFISPEDIFCH